MKRYAIARLIGLQGHANRTQYNAKEGDRIEWDGSAWVTLYAKGIEKPWRVPCGSVVLGEEVGSDPDLQWPGQVGGRMGRGLLGGPGGLTAEAATVEAGRIFTPAQIQAAVEETQSGAAEAMGLDKLSAAAQKPKRGKR
jgi:hypothetical protein